MLKRMMPVDYLEQIKAFWTPDRAVKGAYGMTAEKNHVSARSAEAVCFCYVGAMQHVIEDDERLNEITDIVCTALDGKPWGGNGGASRLSCWFEQKETTYEDAIALLDKAIEAQLVAA